MKLFLLRGWSILLYLGHASLAVAQVAPLEPPALEAPQPRAPEPDRASGEVRLGRLTLVPGVGLKDIGIDTNILDASGHQTRDFMFTTGSRTEAALDLGILRVASTGTADYTYYRTIAFERSFDRGVSGRAELQLGRRIIIYGEKSFEHTRKPFSFEIQGRASRKFGVNEAGVKVGLLRKVILGLAGYEARRRFADNATLNGISLNETMSETSRRASATIAYTLTPLTTIEVMGFGETKRFPNSSRRNSDVSQFTIGATFKPRALITGTARIGYQRTVVLSEAVLGFEGVVGGVGLGYRLRDGLEFGVTVQRTPSPSFEPAYPYYVHDGVGVWVRRHLFGRFNAYVEANRNNHTYAAFATADSPATVSADSELTYWYVAAIEARTIPGGLVELVAEYRPEPSRRAILRQGYGYEGVKFGITISYGRFTVGDRSRRGLPGPEPGIQ